MPAPREGRRTAPARTPHAPAASREDRRPGGAPDNSTRTSSTGTTRNIGIVAHVDAGKTSLTERLLYDTGAIDTLGSVDAGTTRTDSDALERRRGITVRSAVASFTARGTRVNLIDTPGHADFVAEVERALEVLDGAVLVLSAVEGVQPQTRVLMRTLRQMRLPTLLFVNKIDRPGARPGELVAEIRRKLAPHAVPLSRVQAAGSSGAGRGHCRCAPRTTRRTAPRSPRPSPTWTTYSSPAWSTDRPSPRTNCAPHSPGTPYGAPSSRCTSAPR
ncbi:GTP-binding protein [Streptomyces albus]